MKLYKLLVDGLTGAPNLEYNFESSSDKMAIETAQRWAITLHHPQFRQFNLFQIEPDQLYIAAIKTEITAKITTTRQPCK